MRSSVTRRSTYVSKSRDVTKRGEETCAVQSHDGRRYVPYHSKFVKSNFIVV
jgi:hypothetical protein